ncbi:hypothetical protein CAI16_19415 [Virgibacillus dokdonensis]|uniref:Uncharacterized protein n=1 Tax=Virgibacillus dokdonensis TaxID=302167 RepID=A0A3E0WHP4_9BACI|nr:SIR2 family protein [Virgibacillus dokdonensis]RFA31969.1 hypothetical protein CAI16_19415 [Virgibacillus dokdonensis]
MTIKKMILDIVNTESNSLRHSYIAIEKLVTTVLYDYISKQEKEVYSNYRIQSSSKFLEYDIYAPDGFDEYTGSTVLEVKIFRHKRQYRRLINDTVGRFATQEKRMENLIIILVGESPDILDESLIRNSSTTFKVDIWTIDKLIEVCESNIDLFLSTYDNLNKFLIKDTISQGIKRDSQSDEREKQLYIEQLSREYHNDNLVLFLGAGASRKAGIATWDALISELFVALINQEMNKKGIKLTNSDKKSIVNSIQNQNGYSPLLQTRFLRQGFEEEFTDLVRDILYKDAVDTSHLLEELGQLCVPNRGMTGIKAIINYNFDDLIEKNLDRLRVKYHSVYSDGVKINSDELGIYHVHGFLPQNKEEYEDLSKSLLVFSEEGYHKLLLEPYNWANMTQLNYLTNDVCLFIGLSMTDPNLRRLLDIASQKNVEENPNHYAILKRFTITSDNNVGDDIMTFNHVNEELQESFFKELGINIIWVDSFDDIPLILNRIKR